MHAKFHASRFHGFGVMEEMHACVPKLSLALCSPYFHCSYPSPAPSISYVKLQLPIFLSNLIIFVFFICIVLHLIIQTCSHTLLKALSHLDVLAGV